MDCEGLQGLDYIVHIVFIQQSTKDTRLQIDDKLRFRDTGIERLDVNKLLAIP